MFDELECIEVSSIDDSGVYRRWHAAAELADADYGCGLYRLLRPA